MEVKFADVSFLILLKRARRNGVISVGLLTSPAFPSCGQSSKNIFNKYCCCKLCLDQCFLSKWLTRSWNFLYLKHILRQFLATNCYPFVQDVGCIENLKRKRCWVLCFTWHGQSEWWQCCPFGRRKDGRLDVRTCRQVPSSVPVLKWNEQNCLSGMEGGSLFPQPARWLEDLLSVALSGRTQATVSQISGVTYVTGAVRKGMETKCPASGSFFFFNMCASRSYCNTYFSSSKKPEQAVFAKERFYTFLLLCLTAERRHCGMKALVGGSCAQTLAPEVAVELWTSYLGVEMFVNVVAIKAGKTNFSPWYALLLWFLVTACVSVSR